MYHKILVPLDGSELAECALEHVKEIALGCNVPEVVLLRVVEPSYATVDSLSEGAAIYTELINQMQKVNIITEKFRRESGINAQSALIYGNAANEILEYAKKNQVDLIIMTTHGKSGVSRWLFGSVADRVSHHSIVSVLIFTPPGCRLIQQIGKEEKRLNEVKNKANN